MDYPIEFPQDSRARVDAAKAKADRDFVKAEQCLGPSIFRRKYQTAVEKLVKEYITSVFFAFADEVIQVGKRGIWPASCLQSEVEEFGANLIFEAQGKCYDRDGLALDRTHPWDFSSEIRREIRCSEQWLAFLDQVTAVAEAQAAASSNLIISETVADRRAIRSIEKSNMSPTNADSVEKSLKPNEGSPVDLEVAKYSTAIIGSKKKRGPQPKVDFHRAVAEVVDSFGFGANWKELSNLEQIAEKLDKRKIPALQTWEKRDRVARTWSRAVEFYPDLVRKALEYSLKIAAKDIPEKPSEILGNLG